MALNPSNKTQSLRVDAEGRLLVSGVAAPVYSGAWAGKPAAATAGSGAVMRVTDVGMAPYSEWVSDGTVWRPRGGSLTLWRFIGSIAAPVSTCTVNDPGSTGVVQPYTTPSATTLPAGFLAQGMVLTVRVAGTRILTSGSSSVGVSIVPGNGDTPYRIASATLAAPVGTPSGQVQGTCWVGSGSMLTGSTFNMNTGAGSAFAYLNNVAYTLQPDQTGPNLLQAALLFYDCVLQY